MAATGSTAASPPQPPPPAAQLQLHGLPAAGRWVAVVALSPEGKDAVWTVRDGADSVPLGAGVRGPALLCVGGREAATRCQRVVFAEGGPLAVEGPVAGVRVTGRVAVGRLPVAGAEIAVVPHPLAIRRLFVVPLEKKGERELVGRVKSDAQGRYVLPQVAPGRYRLDVHFLGGRTASGEAFEVPDPEVLRRRLAAQKGADPKAPPAMDLGELAVDPGVELTVQVTDKAGQPVPGAGVAVNQVASGGIFSLFEVHADAAGKATVSGLDPAHPAEVTCVAAGYIRWLEPFRELPGSLSCALARFAEISGQIVDADREPVGGARIALRRTDVAATADAKGHFTLPALADGRYELLAAAPGHRAVTRAVTLAAEERRQLEPIVLPTAAPSRGRIVDGGTGEPIAGAAVTVAEPPGGGGATTDEEGRFELAAEAAGEDKVYITVSAARYPETSFAVEPAPGDEPPVYKLRPGGRVHATVWDEAADSPCVGCWVLLRSDAAKTVRLTTDNQGEALSPIVAAGPHEASLERVENTGSLVRVSGGNDVQSALVEPGRVAEVRFGERRPAIEVTFVPPPPADWKLRVDSGPRIETYEPAADGTFHIKKAARDDARLILLRLGGELQTQAASVPADFDRPVLRLPLPATAVSGALTRGGEPLPRARVELVAAASGATVAWGESGLTGEFAAEYLPAGVYRLLVDRRPVQTLTVGAGSPLALGAIEVAPPPAPPKAGGR